MIEILRFVWRFMACRMRHYGNYFCTYESHAIWRERAHLKFQLAEGFDQMAY